MRCILFDHVLQMLGFPDNYIYFTYIAISAHTKSALSILCTLYYTVYTLFLYVPDSYLILYHMLLRAIQILSLELKKNVRGGEKVKISNFVHFPPV